VVSWQHESIEYTPPPKNGTRIVCLSHKVKLTTDGHSRHLVFGEKEGKSCPPPSPSRERGLYLPPGFSFYSISRKFWIMSMFEGCAGSWEEREPLLVLSLRWKARERLGDEVSNVPTKKTQFWSCITFCPFCVTLTKVSKIKQIFNKILKSVWPNLTKISQFFT